MNEDQPGLLQMAQQPQQPPPPIGAPGGMSLADLAASYGPEWQSNPELNAGAPYRPITSPGEQNYSDLQGNPIHMGGPAPKYQSGTTTGGFNSIFDPRAPSSGGGYFSMDDYNKGNPDPGASKTPEWSPGSSNSLSTNNWRLLGDDPERFMINGQVIDRRLLRYMMTPQSVLGLEGGVNPPGMNPAGAPGSGVWARPMGSYGGTRGYPGNYGWPVVATSTY